MNILLIIKDKLEIRNLRGNLINTIWVTGIIYADYNQDQSQIAITTNKGKVEVRNQNGVLLNNVYSSAQIVSAKWYGKDILITYQNGKAELRTLNGGLIKTF